MQPACNNAHVATVREILAAHPDDIQDTIRLIIEEAAYQFV
jgi:hypothetical protein